MPDPTARKPLPVLGLAGGIGAGKSYVARLFGEHGAMVIDSDALARAALDRPDVRSTLVSWWGDRILTADSPSSLERRVDRRAVAGIVFAQPEERKRLEALIHPIVRQSRAEIVKEARARGCCAVVIDAPLLFEAGVDAECDAVVFIDTPEPERLARVLATRGWSEAELRTRELAQLPLEEKRGRSRYTVNGSESNEDIRAEVAAILSDLCPGKTFSGAPER